jgi:hypothetical protein
MAAGQLFGSAPHTRRRAHQAAAHGAATPGGWQRLGREVGDDPGDGPNRLVRLNGPARQLGWQRVLGQSQESE